MLALATAAIAATPGQAVLLSVADEPQLVAVVAEWNGVAVPFARRNDGWSTWIGVDLDTPPGTYPLAIKLEAESGQGRSVDDTLVVSSKAYPTTELTVEPGYVELSPENQRRAARESRLSAEIYATVTPEMLWSDPFTIPVEGVAGGRNFGHRRIFNGQPRAPHSGADLRAPTGTPILAANRGRVVLAEDLFFSGNAVFLDHGQGLHTVYLHLSRIDVTPGQLVERGQVLGLAGATGRVTGPHLHWGARILDARVDPFTLLRERGTE